MRAMAIMAFRQGAQAHATPGGASGKEPTCQCRKHRRCGFTPWVRKIPWRRKWQPTPVFLPGKSHGWGSLRLQYMGSQRIGHDWVTEQQQSGKSEWSHSVSWNVHSSIFWKSIWKINNTCSLNIWKNLPVKTSRFGLFPDTKPRKRHHKEKTKTKPHYPS